MDKTTETTNEKLPSEPSKTSKPSEKAARRWVSRNYLGIVQLRYDNGSAKFVRRLKSCMRALGLPVPWYVK